MIYYLIAAIAPIVGWFFYDSSVKNKAISDESKLKAKKWVVFISILPMILLFILRYRTIGADTPGYVLFFEDTVRSYSFKDLLDPSLMRTEVAFRIYVKIISLFSDNYTFFFLVNAIVIFGSMYRFAFKYAGNPFVFFSMFIALGTYNFIESGLRQGIAMVICLWAIDFIKDKKLLKFCLTVFLAYLFHRSAVIFLMIYPISFLKKYKNAIMAYVMMLITFVIGFSSFQDFFNDLLGYDYAIEETGNGGIFLILTLLICVYSSLVLPNKEKMQKEHGSYVIMHMAFMTVVFWVLRLISRTAERVSYYFIFGIYAQFAETASYKDTKVTLVVKISIIAISVALFIYRTMGTGYLFFWQGR